MHRYIEFFGDGVIANTSEYDIHVNDYPIPSAQVKTNYQDIEGRSGAIDLSEANGLSYNDIDFGIDLIFYDFNSDKFDKLKGLVHGKRMKVVLPHDKERYYNARISVGNAEVNSFMRKSVLNLHCEPYKYNINTTKRTITGTQIIDLENDSMPTVPVITTTAETTIGFGDNTYKASPGTYVFPDILLTYGHNDMSITTDGQVTIEYQEGRL